MLAILAAGIITSGCVGDMEQFQGVSASSDFSVLMVPNIKLDVYIYAKQKSYSTVPGDILNMKEDFDVESMAVWGVTGNNNFAYGMGFTFVDENTAASVFKNIKLTGDSWKLQRENNIYIVNGKGYQADILKEAISENNFVQYKDQQLLDAAALLPKSIRAKLIGLGLAKPGKELLTSISSSLKLGNLEKIDQVIRVANLELIIAGLYSPHSINMSKAMEIYKQGGAGFSTLDMGLLLFVKSGLPGIIVEPRVKGILAEQGFTEVKKSEMTIYKARWNTNGVEPIYAAARIENNYVFIAVSGQEGYAETLITGIYK
jgi:hypothetical protein